MPNTPDPTAVIYNALEGLQGTTYHLPPGTRQAVAEHLARVLPAVSPSAVVSADRATLRDRIAEALMRWAERNNSSQYASMRRPETVRANAYGRADAVLDALLAPATCGAREPEPRTGTSPCVLPAGHGGTKHQDKWTNQWPAAEQQT